jgi:hypothetical protein
METKHETEEHRQIDFYFIISNWNYTDHCYSSESSP